jgi:diadenosine tetraphosphate (Ap4A) HIT family hydrolase
MESVECWTCRSNEGRERISPGPSIHVGEYWQVEHAYPTQLRGWLVIVLRRHIEALHELRPEEFSEFSSILEETIHVLHQVVGCQKEYVACFAEAEHFKHVHFHVIPRPLELASDLVGTKSFGMLKVSESAAVSREEIRELCESLRRTYRTG